MQTSPESQTGQAIKGLYAIADTEILAGRDLLYCVNEAIKGGASLVQLRDKSTDPVRRKQIAVALRELCANSNVIFIVNDDAELARAVLADGVHLGKDDMPVAQARTILGQQSVIGVSCYNQVALADKAQDLKADYVAFGSFFKSVTKPEAVPATLDLVEKAVGKINLPIVAIGGISPDNALPLVNAGVKAIAVASGLFRQKDIRAAAAAYCRIFN